MLVALYESGRKESFDCTCDIFKLLHMRDIFIFGGHRFSSTKSVAKSKSSGYVVCKYKLVIRRRDVPRHVAAVS